MFKPGDRVRNTDVHHPRHGTTPGKYDSWFLPVKDYIVLEVIHEHHGIYLSLVNDGTFVGHHSLGDNNSLLDCVFEISRFKLIGKVRLATTAKNKPGSKHAGT